MEAAARLEEWPANDNDERRQTRVREHVERTLRQVLLTPSSEDLPYGMQETPDRVARMWINELTAGYNVDVSSLFRKFPDEGKGGIVIIKDLPVTSVCEHHMMPIVGYAHVGYFPDDWVLGLSKVARIVNAYSRRFQIQERLTRQVLDAMDEFLKPRGTMVVVDAEHLCMTARGVQAPGTTTVTSCVSGKFQSNEDGEKDEFLRQIGRPK